MDENRKSTRMRSLKGGRIYFNNGSSSVDCIIRNFSSQGAKLVLETSILLPDRFELKVHDGTHHDCKVIWRTLLEVGVHFQD